LGYGFISPQLISVTTLAVENRQQETTVHKVNKVLAKFRKLFM